MDKGKKKSLIKTLLSGKLTQEQKSDFADMESVNEVLKKQWNEAESKTVDMRIKQQIWEKVKAKCEGRKKNQVLVGLWLNLVAALVVILLLIGGIWIGLGDHRGVMNDLVRVEAEQSMVYVLPDSTKVWMEPGSSIEYAKAFTKDRKVWLSGNSLFEVYKHEGSAFRVYINEAYIEVKGTCFLVKQDDANLNEITLFRGKIEFNVESTGEKIIMQPFQKVTYDIENAQTEIENITNINWENGRYNFSDIPLDQLIQTVCQMYKADITLKRNLGKKVLFSGSIRYDETLGDVLDKICFSLNLTKEIHKEQIIIR